MRTLRLSFHQVGYEVVAYFRSMDAVFFTFLFPVVMLGIFAAAFSADGTIVAKPGEAGISVGAYYLPGMVAAGILLSGVQNLAVDIAGEKGNGTLKRLGATPLRPISYFIGKIGQVLVTGILQVALLLTVARVVFGIALPTTTSAWARFSWVFLLGIVTSALLGIALSSLPRSSRSATAVVVPIVLILRFISGVYLRFDQLPQWMQTMAGVFPLKWLAQGMRSVFLPPDFVHVEPGGSWELGTIAVVLGAWCVAGLVISRLTFRWVRLER